MHASYTLTSALGRWDQGEGGEMPWISPHDSALKTPIPVRILCLPHMSPFSQPRLTITCCGPVGNGWERGMDIGEPVSGATRDLHDK